MVRGLEDGGGDVFGFYVLVLCQICFREKYKTERLEGKR